MPSWSDRLQTMVRRGRREIREMSTWSMVMSVYGISLLFYIIVAMVVSDKLESAYCANATALSAPDTPLGCVRAVGSRSGSTQYDFTIHWGNLTDPEVCLAQYATIRPGFQFLQVYWATKRVGHLPSPFAFSCIAPESTINDFLLKLLVAFTFLLALIIVVGLLQNRVRRTPRPAPALSESKPLVTPTS